MTVAYCVTLFIVMHIPVPDTPGVLPGLDKLVHFGAYSVLSILLATWPVSAEDGTRSARSSQAGLGLLAVLIALYAGIDELLQAPVGRTPDLMDWFADICGAACGLTAVFVCRWARISLQPRRA
ncbi:VanZ family protein [Maioricimonas rarisocia]|uniref:VanZ family protein n=1 Tax=Maioricimonas rarisocia TaxID=2528026 RepID=UPI0018D24550|nr:VanZ family protein [Maioricimonas rarisocia]